MTLSFSSASQEFGYGDLFKFWRGKTKSAWYGWLMENKHATFEEVAAKFLVEKLNMAALCKPPSTLTAGATWAADIINALR